MEQDTVPFLDVEKSLKGQAWRLRPADEHLGLAIAERHQLPDLVGRALASRGVGLDAVREFLAPSMRDALPDPSSFKDMDVAAAHIAKSLMEGRRFAVFGDYDVDGATSSALLWRFFDALGVPLRIYIPDRISEGYGPNTDALLSLKQEGADVVITVDCGTLSYEPLKSAADAGLEVIVVDHHKAEPELPAAIAVINPNRLDDDSGQGQLAAVGVAFMLAIAINRDLRKAGWYSDARPEPDLRVILDLVALGTVCDVVPLTGVNRALVTQGLKVMAGRRNIGLAALADVGRVQSAPGTYHAGFVMGPRVNAGGRVGRSELGARLLTTPDRTEAAQISEELDRYNNERKEIEKAVEVSALAQCEMKSAAEMGVITFAAGEGWHPGVIGIVASRLKERYHLPALVIGVEDGIAKGSARSIPGVDIGAAILEAKDSGLLLAGGGHAMAAGLTAEADKLEALEDFLQAQLADSVGEAIVGRALRLDGALSIGGASIDLVNSLAELGPFGSGNAEPKFAFPDVTVAKADIVGADHVRLFLRDGAGARIKAIAFRAADQPIGRALLSGMGKRFHVAGKLKLDDWGAVPKVEMIVEDAAEAS